MEVVIRIIPRLRKGGAMKIGKQMAIQYLLIIMLLFIITELRMYCHHYINLDRLYPESNYELLLNKTMLLWSDINKALSGNTRSYLLHIRSLIRRLFLLSESMQMLNRDYIYSWEKTCYLKTIIAYLFYKLLIMKDSANDFSYLSFKSYYSRIGSGH